eukprot:10263040-Lingulodinium_polyedra.AAC.1
MASWLRAVRSAKAPQTASRSSTVSLRSGATRGGPQPRAADGGAGCPTCHTSDHSRRMPSAARWAAD